MARAVWTGSLILLTAVKNAWRVMDFKTLWAGTLVLLALTVALAAHMLRYDSLSGGQDGMPVWVWDRWGHRVCMTRFGKDLIVRNPDDVKLWHTAKKPEASATATPSVEPERPRLTLAEKKAEFLKLGCPIQEIQKGEDEDRARLLKAGLTTEEIDAGFEQVPRRDAIGRNTDWGSFFMFILMVFLAACGLWKRLAGWVKRGFAGD